MANAKSGKGNPASHRMSNAALKDRRKRCFNNGIKTAEARRKAQQEREKHNRELRDAGLATTWELACARRREARKNDPAVQRRARAYKNSNREEAHA